MAQGCFFILTESKIVVAVPFRIYSKGMTFKILHLKSVISDIQHLESPGVYRNGRIDLPCRNDHHFGRNPNAMDCCAPFPL